MARPAFLDAPFKREQFSDRKMFDYVCKNKNKNVSQQLLRKKKNY
jgi:hypothetical protein